MNAEQGTALGRQFRCVPLPPVSLSVRIIKKMKSKRRLIIAIIIGILSVIYWSYRNFAMQKELQKLSDLIFQAAQPFMNESDFLTFKLSICVAPVAMKLTMWLATINGAMIAFSCVFIYCEIKKFRERKDALLRSFGDTKVLFPKVTFLKNGKSLVSPLNHRLFS